ncbi:hypothetical protein MWU76_16440 [Gelidibacter sp. F2691]|nr:hypothetical protein [Gelidibacter sp. F2691]
MAVKFIAPKLVLLFTYGCLVQYFFFKMFLNSYQYSEHHGIYEYGLLISKGFVFVGFTLSFLFPLIVWLKTRADFNKQLPLLIVGFLPALYFIALYTLSN